jgi:hypothetical protein
MRNGGGGRPLNEIVRHQAVNESSTIAWILYAVQRAARDGPVTLHQVVRAADAVNHAIPTDEELKMSFDWLSSTKLISVEKNAYSPTSRGNSLVEQAQHSKSPSMMSVWGNLTQAIHKMRTV